MCDSLVVSVQTSHIAWLSAAATFCGYRALWSRSCTGNFKNCIIIFSCEPAPFHSAALSVRGLSIVPCYHWPHTIGMRNNIVMIYYCSVLYTFHANLFSTRPSAYINCVHTLNNLNLMKAPL